MSIITNGNLGPVYQPDYFEARQVLAADSALTTTPTVEANFSFNVLKGERVAYRFTLFYDQDNAGDDLQFTISSVDADGSAVVPAFYSQHIIAVVPGSVGFFGVSTTPNTEATLTTAGTGQAIAIIQGVINGNAATNSTVRLLLSKEAAGGATTVQEGSFLELRRF
jgi:hypothetical protein